jgi:hypothetical protein
MSNPKFSVGDAVMLRSVAVPRLNCNFIIIEDINFRETPSTNSPRGWTYKLQGINLSHIPFGYNEYFQETSIRPIPQEKGLTWNECAWKPSDSEVVV